jgi:prepilin-type N-terminal cleavage/methylation domain-containing protein
METRPRQSGVTLTEMTVVVAVVALLVAFGLPAVRTLFDSLASSGGARGLISATLASARAMAAKEHEYVGVRFQDRYSKDGKGGQYMVFIVHDFDKTGLAKGFRAVEGTEPVKLPDTLGVMEVIDGDSDIDDANEVTDKTTFSVIFSSSGRLVIHDVRAINRDGRTEVTETQYVSRDDIFNTRNKVTDATNPVGMFVQDDYDYLGLEQEQSENSFIVYDRKIFDGTNENRRYSDYLEGLEVIYINPYTGTIINR